MKTNSDTIAVCGLALKSRLLAIVIQAVADKIIPDHNADAFKVTSSVGNYSVLDLTIRELFGGLSNWDSVYFLSIAENGYSFEQSLAFFPLFPILVKSFASFIPFDGISLKNRLLISAILLNVLFFTIAAFSLFKFTTRLFGSKKYSLAVVRWFCFNPASIFFTSCYSESLFVALTFTGYWFIESRKVILASLFFGLGSLTRSNGIVTIGFIVYSTLITALRRSKNKKMIIDKENLRKYISMVVSVIISLLPFIGFQMYSFALFCGKDKNEVDWCNRFTLPYSAVQSKYWNVGFLKYYQLKQIPNFILCSPSVACTVAYSVHYFSHTKLILKNLRKFILHVESQILPYVVHALFLVIFGLLFVHVQIITRMLCSSSPVIYWFTASSNGKTKKFVKYYFALYFVIGIVLHSNFYPWT